MFTLMRKKITKSLPWKHIEKIENHNDKFISISTCVCVCVCARACVCVCSC